jgi:hypothetical protein
MVQLELSTDRQTLINAKLQTGKRGKKTEFDWQKVCIGLQCYLKEDGRCV